MFEDIPKNSRGYYDYALIKQRMLENPEFRKAFEIEVEKIRIREARAAARVRGKMEKKTPPTPQ